MTHTIKLRGIHLGYDDLDERPIIPDLRGYHSEALAAYLTSIDRHG